MGVGLPPARLVGAQEGDARRAPLADLPSGRAPLTAYPMDANLKAGARLLNGPAPRRLPALPLKVADGFPVVAGAFIGRPGFESEGG
jgi:hypothetical protein